jgi:flavin reductase (DIM6/NTAB) family NADH-FMN oxidoreductase RutF
MEAQMKIIPLDLAYRYFEPGPVILLATFDGQKNNVMTASYHLILNDGPHPRLGVMLGPWDYSLAVLEKTTQAVIAIPTAELVRTIVKIGNTTGAEIDKFATFKLTPLPATKVKAPLIKECLANFECQLEPQQPFTSAGLYSFRLLAGWQSAPHPEHRLIHHNGNGTFTFSGATVNLKKLMTRYPEYTR